MGKHTSPAPNSGCFNDPGDAMTLTARTALVGAAITVLAAACIKVPYTGRRQFNLVPESVMHGLGANTYQSMLAGKTLQTSGSNHAVLDRVGDRISIAAHEPGFDWAYTLIVEDTLNAWCLPGGKIGFYTGILPVLQNEAGMAFVMGHEVGHATARHGSERLSQNLAIVGGLGALELFLSGQGKLSQEQRGLILGAIGVGAQVGVLLPFSRRHESEADVIGLMYMSAAGYPPEESIKVWDRMGAASGAKPPPFLSTHPPNARRQEVLRDWMDQARKRYERNRLSGDMLATIWSGPVRAPSGTTNTRPPADTGNSGGSTGGSSGGGGSSNR